MKKLLLKIIQLVICIIKSLYDSTVLPVLIRVLEAEDSKPKRFPKKDEYVKYLPETNEYILTKRN